MRKLALLVLFIVALGLAGCAEKVEEVEKAIPKEKEKAGISISSPEDAMRITPSDLALAWYDLRKERDVYIGESDLKRYISTEISVDKIDYYYAAIIPYTQKAAKILEGEFNLENIRDDLRGNNYRQDAYRGMEIWYGKYTVILPDKKHVIYGDKECVQRVIRVIKGEEPSLYDNEYIRKVKEKLPQGSRFEIGIDGGWSGVCDRIETICAQIKAFGISSEKTDTKRKWTAVFAFGSKDSANVFVNEARKYYWEEKRRPNLKIDIQDNIVILSSSER